MDEVHVAVVSPVDGDALDAFEGDVCVDVSGVWIECAEGGAVPDDRAAVAGSDDITIDRGGGPESITRVGVKGSKPFIRDVEVEDILDERGLCGEWEGRSDSPDDGAVLRVDGPDGLVAPCDVHGLAVGDGVVGQAVEELFGASEG